VKNELETGAEDLLEIIEKILEKNNLSEYHGS